jgi:hypothetical protein
VDVDGFACSAGFGCVACMDGTAGFTCSDAVFGSLDSLSCFRSFIA